MSIFTARNLPVFCFSAALGLLANTAGAQNITGDNLTLSGTITQDGTGANYFEAARSNFNGSLCIGNACTTSETNGTGNPPLKLKWSEAAIIFEDTSSSSFADRDWRVGATGNAALEKFVIMDEGADWTDSSEVIPFTIVGGAPENSFWIGNNGAIGLGTSIPAADLHISDGSPTLRLEQTSFTPIAWELYIDPTGNFYTYNTDTYAASFIISPDAPDAAFIIEGDGIGMGTFTPEAQLHINNSDGSAQIKVSETNTTQTSRALLNLQNHGRPDIIMGNTATGGEWAFGAGNNFVLKTGAVGSTDAEKTLHLKLFGASGNMEITGQIITGGGTCGGGCDAVFSPDYELPSIQAHADAMWKLGHLPNVGPTIENQPINVSDKLGRMLNELEHAHIYIAELEQRLARLEKKLDD